MMARGRSGAVVTWAVWMVAGCSGQDANRARVADPSTLSPPISLKPLSPADGAAVRVDALPLAPFPTKVAVIDAGPTTLRPWTVVDGTPQAQPNGCLYEGAIDAQTALYIDGLADSNVFATVDSEAMASVHFGTRADEPVRMQITTAGMRLDVLGRHDTTPLFPKAKMRYQHVFEPFAGTTLHATPQGHTLRIAPTAWEDHDARVGVFRNPVPWVAECTQLSLSHQAFEVTERHAIDHARSATSGGVVLSAEPNGPPLVELPKGVSVSVLAHGSRWSSVEWSGDDGLYRGVTPTASLAFHAPPGDKFGTGRGFGTPRASYCQSPIPLLVLNGARVFRVGTVLPRVRVLLGAGVAGDALGHRPFHLMASPGISMSDGYLLVVRDDDAATCVSAHP